jgi:hypothetical protein
MTPEERNPKVHHQTARGARLALARKEISQESYRAVLAGELSLDQAKKLSSTPHANMSLSCFVSRKRCDSKSSKRYRARSPPCTTQSAKSKPGRPG